MEPNPLEDAALTQNAKSPGTVTVKMIRDHAIKIARLNGRQVRELKPLDYVEARRDLTGERAVEPQPATTESAPEAEHPDPAQDSTDPKVPAPAGEAEDEQGPSDPEKSVG